VADNKFALGRRVDAEDGMLAADRLAWWVELHHDTHTHPFQPRTEGVASGTFAVPTRGHTETNIWLRLYLEARDAQGVADTAWLDLQPRTVTLSFVTTPPGLEVTVDGLPRAAPFSIHSTVGMERDLEAPSPQLSDAKAYKFKSWSNAKPPDTSDSVGHIALVATFDDTTSLTSPRWRHRSARRRLADAGVATAVTAGATDVDGTLARSSSRRCR
jgi:hypothetical protein